MIVLELSSKMPFKREDMYRLLIQKAVEAWKRLHPLFLRWLSGAPPWISAREHSQNGAACHSPPSHALNPSKRQQKSTPCSNSCSRLNWRFKSLHCNPSLEAQNKIGMKIHSGPDVGTGYVHTITVTAANMHDIAQIYALVREDDYIVYGDFGCPSVEVYRNTGEARSFRCGLPHCQKTFTEPRDQRIQRGEWGKGNRAHKRFRS